MPASIRSASAAEGYACSSMYSPVRKGSCRKEGEFNTCYFPFLRAD